MDYIAKTIIASIDFDGVLAQGVNAKIKYAKKMVWRESYSRTDKKTRV